MRMRLANLLVFLCAGGLGCRSQGESGGRDTARAVAVRWAVPPEVTGVVRGLAYRVRHHLRPDTLTTTLALTNPGPQAVRLMFGGCSLELYLHAVGDSLGVAPPVFRSDRQRAATLPTGAAAGCAAYLAGHDLAPGTTLEAREFVTWSLPDKPPLTILPAGTYAAVLRLGILEQREGRAVQDTLVMPAGSFQAH
jgi:hypothetical protein